LLLLRSLEPSDSLNKHRQLQEIMVRCEILYGVAINQATYEKCFQERNADHFQEMTLTHSAVVDKVKLTEDMCIRHVINGQFANDADLDWECYVIIGVPFNWIQTCGPAGFTRCDTPNERDEQTFLKFIAANPALKDLTPQLLVYVEQ
jgi:hypothetical protein